MGLQHIASSSSVCSNKYLRLHQFTRMGDHGKDISGQMQAGQTKTTPPPMGAPSRGKVLPCE